MIARTKTFTNIGLLGQEITVEADSNKSLPTIEIIGLPDTTIREAKERIRASFRNIGIDLPKRKFILNLSPSDLKKVGTAFDLPMAVALLCLIADGKVAHYERLTEFLFFGELGLDGSVKRVNGILPSVISAKQKGYQTFFIPAENFYELEYVSDITLIPISHFSQIANFLIKGASLEHFRNAKNLTDLINQSPSLLNDFSSIKGQIIAKRALSIAAAGLHNVLMVWAPGSGKTMLSKALPSILPPLDFPEILEVSQIYSVVWKLNKDQPLITQRPFRQVHHTASKVSIIGGGTHLTPGEISLAHKGILFFDELTEFPREVLEVLRQPLEDSVINISRVSGTVEYPANVMFIASMNPCKCGYYKDPEKSCSCSLSEIKRYQSKISGPLLDRIDMILEIPREKIDTLLTKSLNQSSAELRQQVIKAWKIQKDRFWKSGIQTNAMMEAKDIDHYIQLDSACKDFLSQAAERFTLSGRVIHRLLKLGRTIADMEGKDQLEVGHLMEAIHYRSKTMFVENE